MLQSVEPPELEEPLRLLLRAERIFVFGAGRSGLALQMAAMRLMHLGLQVYVAGETTTPAIGPDDLLLVASASGTSASAVHMADVAVKAGATVLFITASMGSPLAGIASAQIYLPAATNSQFAERASAQYAGSLFEQSVLLVCDALFHLLWKATGCPAEELMKRHANLE